MSLTAEEHMPMLQTALIGQTFALLSDVGVQVVL